jgi:hypothetical protein
MSSNRRGPASDVAVTSILTSRRRCALCFGLQRDWTVKEGQLAHLDRNRANNDPSNLVFLCLEHHNAYDTRRSQARNISADELRRYVNELQAFLATALITPNPRSESTATPSTAVGADTSTCSPEAYRLRIPIYHAANRFVGRILGDIKVELVWLADFARETDEAGFLFGPEVADYLATLYKKAVQLRSVSQRMLPGPGQSPDPGLAEEDQRLFLYFEEHFDRWRKLVLPYLRLG